MPIFRYFSRPANDLPGRRPSISSRWTTLTTYSAGRHRTLGRANHTYLPAIRQCRAAASFAGSNARFVDACIVLLDASSMFHSEPSSAVCFLTSDVAISETLRRIRTVALNVVRWRQVRYVFGLSPTHDEKEVRRISPCSLGPLSALPR